MPDTLSPSDIQKELARRLPNASKEELEKLALVFVDLAAGKYITGKRWEKAKRNAAIRALYDGHNLRQLAHQFHLSPRHIRRLARKK